MKNRSIWNDGEIKLDVKKKDYKSLLQVLNELPQERKIDIFDSQQPLCVGKTVQWILDQNAFSSILALFGREVQQYTDNKQSNRCAIILK